MDLAAGIALTAFLGIFILASLFLLCLDISDEYKRSKALREQDTIVIKQPFSPQQEATEAWVEEQEVA